MTFHNMEQGSSQWMEIRCGKVTASRVADIVAKTKSGPSASRTNYAAQLVSERLTGTVEQSFCSPAMAWGTNTEADARNAYAFMMDTDVLEVGFVDHPTIGLSGASPDGLVGDDGLVELKAPNTATHIATLLSGSVPAKYVTQIQWQLACTGRKWADFASYDPRLPEAMRLFVKRLDRDDATIAALELEVALFLTEVAETVDQLQAAYGPAAQLNILRAG